MTFAVSGGPRGRPSACVCRRGNWGAECAYSCAPVGFTGVIGEAARLIFCRLMLQKPNFLVLDEPTNHLDLESINALNIALQKYAGTVLLVTHDHDLIEEVATRIWHFDSGRIEDFKGTYEEYAVYAQQKAS